jgi:hypothetical protein
MVIACGYDVVAKTSSVTYVKRETDTKKAARGASHPLFMKHINI